MTAIYEHLVKADIDDRPYLRYFTLSHPNNDPKIANELMPVYRAALSKAINSLSWKPRIVLPIPVDPRETVFVVDIRDLDWDRDHKWSAIMAEYPYGLTYQDNNEEEIRRLDEEIRNFTNCQIPTVRGDWFIMTATRPPLYHVLLNIPKNAVQLEQRLNVDIPENFRKQRLVRSAFTKGGVSEQNREIERHDALFGAYWKSYDFLNQSERIKRNEDPAKVILVKFPLGPKFDHHPYPGLAFEQDGGEIIFNLPNRLQGYMLVDAKDNRIDAGPIEVVSDSKKVSGTNVILNGLSCIVCHDRGMATYVKSEVIKASRPRKLPQTPNKMENLPGESPILADSFQAEIINGRNFNAQADPRSHGDLPFSGVTFTGTFDRTDFSNAKFENCKFDKCKFINSVNVYGARMINCQLVDCNFRGANTDTLTMVGTDPGGATYANGREPREE